MQLYTPRLASLLLLIYFLTAYTPDSQGQMTVGLFENDSMAYNGYTLFAPSASRDVYLIDNCGYKVNEWRGPSRPAQSVYLLENGNLLRTNRIPTPIFIAGGSGGGVSIYDWDDNLVWDFEYSTSTYHQHHDVEMLPNGNVLILAWEAKTQAEAIALGRDPTSLGINGLWPESIIEVQPIGLDSGAIVWEWHMWDHLIQDFDASKPNFGVVSDHPERIDINFRLNPSADWVHANGIDYNEDLDQILISVRHFSEMWIIDHSTTTAEAASSSGGNSGKGGDLLYRWGNPQVYKRGTAADRTSWVQHNAGWVPNGYPDAGKIVFFNNGTGRPGGDFSTADMFTPPVDAFGNYSIGATTPYGPAAADLSLDGTAVGGFYSSILSGASQLPNGNFLICSANDGRFFELDQAGNLHWNYICPVNNAPIIQGTTPFGNQAFRAERYSEDFPGFVGKDLTPGVPVEAAPIPYLCNIYPTAPANCDAPVGLVATPLDATTINLTWATAPNDFKYQIQGRIAGSGGGFASRVSATNSRTLPGLTPGETYEWQVRKLCTDSSISTFSTLESFTMPTSLMARLGHDLGYAAHFTTSGLFVNGPSTGQLRLLDLNGRSLLEVDGDLQQREISTALPAGVYLLEIRSEAGYWTSKLYR